MASAWDRVHPRLSHRAAWLDHHGPLPVIEGTLIRLAVDHLPGDEVGKTFKRERTLKAVQERGG